MDWDAFKLSLQLALYTVLLLLPLAILTARWMVTLTARRKAVIEAMLTIPLILPPTVMGFFLLVTMSESQLPGRIWRALFDQTLVFSFEGLLLASIIVNIPFAVQPALRALESIGNDLREAAETCGMSRWHAFKRIELPLAWPGILTGAVLTFAHTLGEFGVVLMVGGNIPGETRTISIAIYDQVQSFDNRSAAIMAAILLAISVLAISITFLLTRKPHVRIRA
ncbi:MAG: molybdate ABC transporter permease subunit [Gammaproteobacteria bacterium]|nr:MAG: molybdate ABC transporter permease subunit [Gammaproteobacteria bacterium]